MNRSESVDKLVAALVAAQAEMPHPPKDSQVNAGARQYRYACLATVIDTVKPVLARHGLAVMQAASTGQHGPVLTTTVLHSSGQWLEAGALELPAGKQDAQGWGSALSYARRYSLLAVAGVTADEDDDGQAASKPATAKKPAAVPAEIRARPQSAVALPADGKELKGRLEAYERKLAAEGVCEPGALIKEIVAEGIRSHDLGANIEDWGLVGIRFAIDHVRTFEALRRARAS